jgi:hypothetical protein
MKQQRTFFLALLLWGLTITLAAVAFILRSHNSEPLAGVLHGAEQLAEDLFWLVLIPAAPPVYATVGLLIARQRPANVVGWLCLLLGLSIVAQDAAWQYAVHALLRYPGQLPFAVLAAWIEELLALVMFPLLPALLLMLFPDGRFLTPRWPVVAWLLVGSTALAIAAGLVQPLLRVGLTDTIDNPTAVPALAAPGQQLQAIAANALLFWLALAAFSVVLRWQRSRGVARQQLKWFAYAVLLTIVAGSSAGAAALISGRITYLVVLLGGLALSGLTIGVPLAMAAAMLRYRLYDIDLVINRTLVYGTLTFLLLLIYFGSVILFQLLFRLVTGQGSQLAIVASTLAIAALFNPLRQRIQEFIDRRFYRRKYNALQTLAEFSEVVRNEVELDDLGDELLCFIRETLQPAEVSLWLKPAEEKGV